MDKESKPAWNVLGLDANLGNVRYGGKLTVRLGGSESQLRVASGRPTLLIADAEFHLARCPRYAAPTPLHHIPGGQQNHHRHRHQRQHGGHRHAGSDFVLRHFVALREQEHVGPHGQRCGHDHHGQGQS